MNQELRDLRENVSKVFFGEPSVLDRVLCCLLARGHLLLEDVPGVGKTVLATALAKSLDCTFSRLQLTPDLLPSDILGVEIFNRNTNEFVFKRGPIFANVVLADEINRTPPRTQSALLEAMNEATVSVEGRVLELERPFMVIATQNPYDFEGTYFLPENQLDRFLMRLSLGYPTPEAEARVLEVRPANVPLHELKPVLTRQALLELQARVDRVTLSEPLRQYIVRFANASRSSEALLHGLSPRGSLALAQASRATALLAERDYCTPDDVVQNVVPVCAHRVIARTSPGQAPVRTEALLETILHSVPSPT
ncbi:MAG: AAA domain-containing protein [Tepidisphaera sp.]|nr:AAA domain-containing protein [Tepidisphaera sp.]